MLTKKGGKIDQWFVGLNCNVVLGILFLLNSDSAEFLNIVIRVPFLYSDRLYSI